MCGHEGCRANKMTIQIKIKMCFLQLSPLGKAFANKIDEILLMTPGDLDLIFLCSAHRNEQRTKDHDTAASRVLKEAVKVGKCVHPGGCEHAKSRHSCRFIRSSFVVRRSSLHNHQLPGQQESSGSAKTEKPRKQRIVAQVGVARAPRSRPTPY